jgi:hypothetical protein
MRKTPCTRLLPRGKTIPAGSMFSASGRPPKLKAFDLEGGGE